MAINFDFYKTTGHFAGEEKQWHVRPVASGTVQTEEMMERIERSTTLTKADLKAALGAFVEQIGTHLIEGKNVHIEGLGHFSLSIGGDVQQTEEGKLRLKNPAVRTVNFRPESALMHRLACAKFTSGAHRGRQSAAIDEAQLPSLLADLCEEKGHFTSQEFQKALRLTPSTARRHLLRLSAEGVIENIASPRFALYRVKGKEERLG